MKNYVVADIHGFYDQLVNSLNEVGFFNDTTGRLIVCGDILDRGKQAKETVDFLLKLHKEGRLIYIAGNHEDLFMECLHQIVSSGIESVSSELSVHYRNKTFDTLLQLSDMTAEDAWLYPKRLVARVMDSDFYKYLLPEAIDYYETEKYVFCHGWIPVIVKGTFPVGPYVYNPWWREATVEQWRMSRWLNGMDMACNKEILEYAALLIFGEIYNNDNCPDILEVTLKYNGTVGLCSDAALQEFTAGTPKNIFVISLETRASY